MSGSGIRPLPWPVVLAAITLNIIVPFMAVAKAQGNDAEKILRRMSDYVADQKTLSMAFDSDVEEITANHQKFQFASSGHVQLSRPDKLRATQTGGYRDIEITFDGTTLTVGNRRANTYAQMASPGLVDHLIDLLPLTHRTVAPGVYLLLPNAYEVMMAGVIEGVHVGQGVIDGALCDHLAFRNVDADWQIWVEVGARPIPRKYVITSKDVIGAPQYTLRIKEWRSGLTADDSFTFTPADGAKKVDWDELLLPLREVPGNPNQGLELSPADPMIQKLNYQPDPRSHDDIP